MDDVGSKRGCGCGCFVVLVIVGFIILGIVGLLLNDSDDSDVDDGDYTKATATEDENDHTSEADTEEITEEKHNETYIDVDTLYDELEENALAASQKYKGEYIAIRGKVGNIDSDGKYFDLEKINNIFSISSVRCSTNGNRDVIDQLSKLTKDQEVVVHGYISDVGEVIGYFMDLDYIEMDMNTDNTKADVIFSYDYEALDYAGSYTGYGGYTISFSAYSSVESDEIGVAEIYYDGELVSTQPIYMCDDRGDWSDWNYDQFYVMYCDGYNEYLGFYEMDGNRWVDYNGSEKNYDSLEMIEHYEL